MNKVTFTYKSGRERVITERDARLLQRLGKGTYLARVMAPTAPLQAASAPAPQPVPAAPVAAPGIDLDAMDAPALHKLAKDRGVKVHHASGAEKVRAALREAAE